MLMKDDIVYSYIKDIAQRLKDPRKYGDVSVMIGAGFSKNAHCKGISDVTPPNWSELAEKMYEELYPFSEDWDDARKRVWENKKIIKTSGKNVTKLAEEYIANFDRNKINNLIEQAIADEMYIPGELHRQLLKLNWSDIFTTNYDTLLERTVDLIYREKNYEIIYSQNDLPGSIKPRIIKLHGSIPQVKPYIICDEDYRTYPIKYSALVNTVQQAMLETRLCLIGFSGDDPNFQSWLGWLRDNMGENCPTIYLIGVYDELSDPERKLMDNKGITIVDISSLVDKLEKNRHYKAIAKFLDQLEKLQEEKDLYGSRPYPKMDMFSKPDDWKKYTEDLKEYSGEVIKKIEPYVLLPEKIRINYADYFSIHFFIIIKNNREILEKALINIIKILKKCLVILDDKNIEYLEKICGLYREKGNKELLYEGVLYLLERYRIDGKWDEYKKCKDLIKCLQNDNLNNYSEILVEEIKYNIALLDYEKANTLVEKFTATNFVNKIRKAGFYKQLNQIDKAECILEKCSAELAQMKLSDEVFASYLGYLNLCFRAKNWIMEQRYSDSGYYDNPYNTRRIITEQGEIVSRRLFEEGKKNKTEIPFDLNTSQRTIQLINGDEAILKTYFPILLAIDKLCLPFFYDQIKILPNIFEKILDSSENIYWKLSLAIRGDEDKSINAIFTRKILRRLDANTRNDLLDRLLKICDLYLQTDITHRYFISVENLLTVMSRLIVFMDDESVIAYIKILNRFSDVDDHRIMNRINTALDTICTRFNGYIAKECQDIIFIEFPKKFHLASFFEGLKFEIDEKSVKEYYDTTLELLCSMQVQDRDTGVAQLLLLWDNCRQEDYVDKIISYLWQGKSELPNSELFCLFIWEKLPHPDNIEFTRLYGEYFIKNELTDQSKGGYNSVWKYMNSFFVVSDLSQKDCEKIILTKENAVKILENVYKYLLNEEERANAEYDFMGYRYESRSKVVLACQMVALIYIEAFEKNFLDEIESILNDIKEKINEYDLFIPAIDMVDLIRKGNYKECIEFFEESILLKNKESYMSLFIGMQCLVYHLESTSEDTTRKCSLFEKFISSLKYFDIEYAKSVWIQLAILFEQKFFRNNVAQAYISKAIKQSMTVYGQLANEGERYYLDGLYNCIVALKRYYESLLKNKINVSIELQECVTRAKNIDNYEIQNIWKV